MTAVAFHLRVPHKIDYTCRLLRKAVAKGSRLVVTGEAQTLAQLDLVLWTFSATDFVAHCSDAAPGGVLRRSPVVLSQRLMTPDAAAILVNLGSDVPAGFADFLRVIEVVADDEQEVALARSRWKSYKQAGCQLNKHEFGETVA